MAWTSQVAWLSIISDCCQDSSGSVSCTDAGAYFAPYKPITMSKGFGEEDGQPRIFFRTRYAVATNPFGVENYFRKITVADLPT